MIVTKSSKLNAKTLYEYSSPLVFLKARLPRLFAPPWLSSEASVHVPPFLSLITRFFDLPLAIHLSPFYTMSSSSKGESDGIAPQNKGSWATFLKVRNLSKPGSTASLIITLVDSILQWRPLINHSSPIHPRHYIPHRVLGILD